MEPLLSGIFVCKHVERMFKIDFMTSKVGVCRQRNARGSYTVVFFFFSLAARLMLKFLQCFRDTF